MKKLKQPPFVPDTFNSLYGELKDYCTNSGSLSLISVFFVIIVGFLTPIDEITSKYSSCSPLWQEQYLPIQTRPLVDAVVFYSSIP
jgi:hypothetical protein